LLQKAHIKKNVILIGVSEHLEIWDETEFENHKNKTQNTYTEIAERLDNE
jgi:DNA-binding transcriptional regulator/RsmH inhibitor MraZ